jgi:muramoyltetrapeptide carboxypeptidase
LKKKCQNLLKAAISPVGVIKPARPQPGDTFGILAPSSPFDDQAFQAGLEVLETLGFRVRYSKTIFEKKKYLAGPDALRAQSFNAMFADPEITAVICARGGYGALRILPLIDFDLVRAHPKLLIGFSDVTALLTGMVSGIGMPALHGPMVASLGKSSPSTRQAFSSIFLNTELPSITPEHPVVIKAGNASGKLIGGNLATLCHLIGTPFMPDLSGHILLLEDVGELPYRIDRMLVQMKMAGCFDRLAGIVLGSFKNCGDPDDLYEIFNDIFETAEIPILAGFDVGHDEPNLCVPLGIRATLDTGTARLAFMESLFS